MFHTGFKRPILMIFCICIVVGWIGVAALSIDGSTQSRDSSPIPLRMEGGWVDPVAASHAYFSKTHRHGCALFEMHEPRAKHLPRR
jgi:hypothetical protein